MKHKANFAYYITMVPLTDSMPSFSLRYLSPHNLIKQKKMSTHYNWNCFAKKPEITKLSKAMKPKANFAQYITMVPLTDSMPSFSIRCLSPHGLIKQMLNVY